ncbi:transcriptional regulator [Levilactobacillus namurensis DSM 19117]|uniref:Transcriptional regulator n=1 Tax=Levilactobacillus namurensis DSM 19117 TaxID=1423773 RepID=A0A0R1JN20_9LACO|nr:MerR family transcriptional regulator [Levilactobacillus namurensis]KRK72854.1 transcriptional regulator [Levilactobacillus namurensis DSM 19117]GEO75058.1 transcriptional regulator [Levilactobacillus namurensis]HJE45292.1 MerR family transcriptional regulator [Levilactobacillus namurensis]
MSYSIHQVADLLGISTYRIRYYHDHGMLPYVKRDAHNNRIFDDSDIDWLRIIICLRATGMPVERICHYLDLVQEGDATIPERYQMMKAQQDRTLSEIQDLQDHLTTINCKVDGYAEILATGAPDKFAPRRPTQPTAQS